MASNDTSPDHLANLTAAAHAAASWARARRTMWADAPASPASPAIVVATESPAEWTSPAELASIPEAAPTPVPPPPVASLPPPLASAQAVPVTSAPPAPVAIPRTGPSLAARTAKRVMPWLARVAVAAALLAGGVAGWPYVLNLWTAATTSKTPVAPTESAPVKGATTAQKAKGTLRVGTLQVRSTPPGARVVVDGRLRGVTPLSLADVSVGLHTIELKSDAGSVQRTITVAADQTADIDESIFSGWLAVYSPFDLVITEGGRSFRLDDRNQLLLAPGRHELHLTNRTLGYDVVRQVELKPGEVTTLSLKPPPSTMSVTASEAAEVWVDGARVGETPVNDHPAEIGSHEIVVRRAAGGERRFTVTVPVRPFSLNVDFSKP